MTFPTQYTFTTWLSDADRIHYVQCGFLVSCGYTRVNRSLAKDMTKDSVIPDAPVRVVNEAGGLLKSYPSIYKLAGRK